jgi:hypothetical protein
MSSGGSSSPTTTTNLTSNIPAYAQPYVMGTGTASNPGLLPQAAALTNIANNPYQQYQGQMNAGFSPLQQQGMSNIQQMTPSSQNQAGTGMAGLAGMQAGNIGSAYNPGPIGAQQTGINNYNQGAVNQYMSPYTQDVINQQSNQAIGAYAQNLPTLGSVAAGTGNLGSSREALSQDVMQQGLQSQLQGIQAQGLQSGFGNAQNQFNTQNALGLQSQTANQGANLQAQSQGLQSQQFGANLGLQGLQTQLGAASTLGQLGNNQYYQQSGIDTAQLTAGAQQQALQQQGLNTNYQNFVNQQNYPYAQLGYLSDILHGTASTAAGSGVYSAYQQTPNVAGQIAGLGPGSGWACRSLWQYSDNGGGSVTCLIFQVYRLLIQLLLSKPSKLRRCRPIKRYTFY